MRKIIVLKNGANSDGTQFANYIFWLIVPLAAQRANANFVTQVPDATTQEKAALADGSVVEESYTISFTNTTTLGNKLVSDFNVRQSFYNAQSTLKNYTGTYWDGTSWQNLPA